MAEKGKKETKQGAPSTPSEQKQKHGQRHFQRGQEQKKKDPQEIPIMRYGPANNFAKFREALSKTAMKEHGNLGKLIKLGTYFEPKCPIETYMPWAHRTTQKDSINWLTLRI